MNQAELRERVREKTVEEALTTRVPGDTTWTCYARLASHAYELKAGETISFPTPFGWEHVSSTEFVRYPPECYSLQGHLIDVLDAIQKIRDSSEEGTHCYFSFLGLAMNYGGEVRLDFTLFASNKGFSAPGPLLLLRKVVAGAVREHLEVLNRVLDYDDVIKRHPEFGLAH